MSLTKLIRLSGLALAGSGVATIGFWLTTIPFKTFAGPDVAVHPLFVPGQILHLIAAILAVIGYIGLYLHIRERTAAFGYIAFITAVVGAIFVFGDAVLGLVVFPVLSQHAPALTDATGPMFTGTVLGIYIMFFATNMIGIVALGIAVLKSTLFARAAVIMLIVGGILSNLPPNPALHLVLIVGGVALGIGATWLGWSLGHIKGID